MKAQIMKPKGEDIKVSPPDKGLEVVRGTKRRRRQRMLYDIYKLSDQLKNVKLIDISSQDCVEVNFSKLCIEKVVIGIKKEEKVKLSKHQIRNRRKQANRKIET